MQWNPAILDAHVAPGFSSFTSAEIPPLSDAFPQAPHWLANHFLNAVLRGTFTDGQRQACVAFLRRVQECITCYSEARTATQAHFTRGSAQPGLKTYYAAVAQWEATLLQLSIALDTMRFFGGGTKLFAKNDGTPLQRLYTIANHVKHVGSCISSGQCTPADTLPLWLSSSGLCSFDTEATWAELASVIDELTELADMMQDPITFADKLRASIDRLQQ